LSYRFGTTLLFSRKTGGTLMKRKGFTLLELMIVVAIISILASVSIPALMRYIRKSKTAEATLNLRKMYDGEMAYFQEEHTVSSGTVLSRGFVHTRLEPGSTPGVNRRLGNFDSGNWNLINFGVDSPVQYSYLIEVLPDPANPFFIPPWVPGYGWAPPTGTYDAAFLARAFGDLDGDGRFSQFARAAGVKSGVDEPEGFGGIYVDNELE
jgi:type IV pilus assembly protein PilA